MIELAQKWIAKFCVENILLNYSEVNSDQIKTLENGIMNLSERWQKTK